MERHNDDRVSAHILETAGEWFVEFRTGNPSEAARGAFLAWLRECPAHMRAYLEVTALWNDTAAINQDGRWSVEELIRQARTESDNVVALETHGRPVSPPAQGQADTRHDMERVARRHRLRVGLLSAAATLVVLVLAGLAQWYVQRGTYSTGIGEQRSVALEDGSTVQLNARSKLRVDFAQDERRVELIQGQALFQVARDPARPFSVVSDATRVRAVGTQFDVNRKANGTVVTVLEGKVAVFEGPVARNDIAAAAGSSEPQPVYVSAGEQLALTTPEATVSRQINTAAVTAWTQRQLVFEATPLAEVAEEFNRYNQRQLIVRDPELEAFQIDGVFSSTDTASLVRFLRTRPGIEVTETASTIVLERR